jgi:hypothetical protein
MQPNGPASLRIGAARAANKLVPQPSTKEKRAMWPNRTVCLVGITLALQAASGCIAKVNTHDGRGGGSYRPVPTYDSGLSVEWELAYLDGQGVACEGAGTPTVTVVAQQLGSGARTAVSFPCDDQVGVVDGLAPGSYDVSLYLEDEVGRTVSAVDYGGLVVLAGRVTEPAYVTTFPIQAWDVAWTLAIYHRDGRATPASCGDVGAATVRFITQLGAEAQESYDMGCNSYGAITTAIRPGDYLVQMQLLDRAGRTLADTDIVAFPVTMREPALVDIDFGL